MMTKILFLRLDNKIGDSIVESFFIRELKKLFPQAQLVLMTSADPALFQENPHVDELISIRWGKKGWLNTLAKLPYLRKQHFDLLIASGHTLKRKILYTLIGAPKFISTERCLREHITARFADILRQLGATQINTAYELFIPAKAQAEAEQFMQAAHLTPEHFLVFNPLGSDAERSFSQAKIESLLHLLRRQLPADYPIVLLDYKNQYAALAPLCARFTCAQIMPVAHLIKQAGFVLTTDTGIAHIADVFGKKILVLFSLQRFQTEVQKQEHIQRWKPLTPSTDWLKTDNAVDAISNQAVVQKILQGIKG